jgi:SAM-dependent methyltransferase
MADADRAEEIAQRTIRDFGEQWSHYEDNEGFYASQELLADVFGPLLPVAALEGIRAADVGSGTGRFARLMLEAGARHVHALEPSQAVETLRRHLAPYGERASVQHGRGDELPAGLDLDLVFSFGVLQFIPDPVPVVAAAHAALRPGGKLVFWVYGKEGGVRLYAGLVTALRAVTVRLPHPVLSGLCSALNALLDPYIFLCRHLPLPLRDYVVNTLGRLSRRHRKLVIYDQLNPRYVRFYAREEVEALLRAGGFSRVELYHRHGYSWTALGVKDPA